MAIVALPLVPEGIGATPSPQDPSSRAKDSKHWTLSSGSFEVQGSPYRWRFKVTRRPGGSWTLKIGDSRSFKDRDTYLDDWWVFQLPKRAVQTSSDLGSIRIDTGDSLDRYGRLRLHLGSLSEPRRSDRTCRATAEKLATVTHRSGSWRGSFRFKPKTEALPKVVQASGIPGKAHRSVSTGASCPGTTSSCWPAKWLRVSSSTATFLSGPVFFAAAAEEGPPVAPATRIWHVRLGFLRHSPFTLTDDSIMFEPRETGLHGSLTFAKGAESPLPPDSKCRGTTWSPTTWESGKLRVGFTNGKQIFSGNIEKVTFDKIRGDAHGRAAPSGESGHGADHFGAEAREQLLRHLTGAPNLRSILRALG
jgi:hypothetical protein